MSLNSLLNLYYEQIVLEDGREALKDKATGVIVAYREKKEEANPYSESNQSL